jgi:hypothetical protein
MRLSLKKVSAVCSFAGASTMGSLEKRVGGFAHQMSVIGMTSKFQPPNFSVLIFHETNAKNHPSVLSFT